MLGFAVAGGVGAVPATAAPTSVVERCPQAFVAGGVRYTTEGQAVDTATQDFNAATAEECRGGAAAAEALLRTRPAPGAERSAGGWRCTASATGAACLANLGGPPPARVVRVDARCETAGPGEDDPDGEAAPDDGADECLRADGPEDGGSTGGSGGSDGSGESGGGAVPVVVVDRRREALLTPNALELSRAVRATGLRWRRWGRAATVARGRIVLRRGARPRAGTLRLSGRVVCRDGRRVYTRARARAGGRTVVVRLRGCSALPD